MKLKFLACGTLCPGYSISGETVNGIDLSIFPQGGQFVGNDETFSAGIFSVERDEAGELLVTLAQQTKVYHVPVFSHDWEESNFIDSVLYDPAICYCIPTAMPDGCEAIVDMDGACTVVKRGE
ncbi:hypothetical protein [Desulfuromonas acetoxidans]|uniref:hypothetical protein n=1 Tax=Desulfuromonas acetoxidans TaxID=891 RepID=UPI00292FD418|nr:hypothetical protein [Desulfuromonas acetoxidans]